MFLDSNIAEGFAIGPAKASYVICCGLISFYKQNIMNQYTPKDAEPPYFVLCFDEAFNSVSNQKHLVMHYFDEYLQRTHRLYFNSQFMCHARASHLIQSLIEVLKNLD